MSDVQRVIKYVAIAFAIYLIVNIISVIVFGISSMFFLFDDNDSILEEMKVLTLDGEQVFTVLDIDIRGTSLDIVESKEFKVETNNKYIEVNQSNDKVTIKEKKQAWYRNSGKSKLVVYMPADMELEKFIVDAGAGKVSIDSARTRDLDFNLGAGQVTIGNLIASKKAKIDGGAGEIIIKDGSLNNLDFDMGVGRAEISAEILGKSDIDAGVGELEIHLFGKKDDYQITVDKGVGMIRIDGESMKSSTYGDGTNKIDIDGGVGSIRIEFGDKSNDKGINNSESKEPNPDMEKPEPSPQTKEFTRTYKVLSVVLGEKEQSYYLTLQVYQGEVDTVKVENFSDTLIQGKTYEFTFMKDSTIQLKEDTIEEIFKNYKLERVQETEKRGNEQVQENVN